MKLSEIPKNTVYAIVFGFMGKGFLVRPVKIVAEKTHELQFTNEEIKNLQSETKPLTISGTLYGQDKTPIQTTQLCFHPEHAAAG